MSSSVQYVCPACRAAVVPSGEAYDCGDCGRRFPILSGVADFRLFADSYLSLEDERAKAAKLDAFARKATFAALVDHYYAITGDVPKALAARFAAYVHGAPERAKPPLSRLGDDAASGTLLDLGCGSGGALIAASSCYATRVGVDIALRWLVIARKRLAETGIEAQLVCANAEALPFPPMMFTHVLADGLIDNVQAADAVLREAARVMTPRGRFWLSAGNRRWIGPHPATGVWAAGLVPEQWRQSRLERKHGFDLLRAVALPTASALRRMAAACGLRTADIRPRQVDPTSLRGRSNAFRVLAHAYRRFAKLPGFRALLIGFGPAFEILFTKKESGREA